MKREIVFCASVLVCFAGLQAQPVQLDEFTPCRNGCQSVVLAGGNQFVIQGGNGVNSGTLLFIDSMGDQAPMILGLPAGNASDGTKFGPIALAQDGNNLYLTFGEADQFHSTGPLRNLPLTPTQFSGFVIQVVFSTDPANEPGPFYIQQWDREAILIGTPVTLTAGANTATISRVATLPAGAKPVGIAKITSAPKQLFVVDSGSNLLLAIDQTSGVVSTLLQFPGTPENVRPYAADQLLVSLFGRVNSVWVVNPITADSRVLTGGLSSVVDAIALHASEKTSVYVLENSADEQGLGQLVLVDSTGPKSVLVNALNDPASLSIDEATGRLFIYSRGDGVIYSIAVR